jgi:serine/threonine protein phosphatase PrpC
MTVQRGACPRCASVVQRDDRFCERCGAIVMDIRCVALPRETEPVDGIGGPCSECGNATFAEGYCTVCGTRLASSDRDEEQLGGIAVVTDRGREHARNEDAAAMGILPGDSAGQPSAIAVAVCDGVSTSAAGHLAAAAAARAGVDAMLTALAAGRPSCAAVLVGLQAAAGAAAAAGADTDPANAPSCTYTAATVEPAAGGGAQITVGNVGDSRAYWIPDPPQQGRRLTVDDSLAQELITAGAAPESDVVQRGAHTLTRWLGADAEPTAWAEPDIQTITTTDSGALLVCTDGLWNYLPDIADIAPFCRGTDSFGAARALVDHALHAGGRDNITVVVIPIGGPHELD